MGKHRPTSPLESSSNAKHRARFLKFTLGIRFAQYLLFIKQPITAHRAIYSHHMCRRARWYPSTELAARFLSHFLHATHQRFCREPRYYYPMYVFMFRINVIEVREYIYTPTFLPNFSLSFRRVTSGFGFLRVFFGFLNLLVACQCHLCANFTLWSSM